MEPADELLNDQASLELDADPMRLNNERINRRICACADGALVHWLDIAEAFLEPDGCIAAHVMPDAVHLSELGYQRWAEALAPTLERLGV